jgi:tryptophanyl-tRNA synthetase
MTILTGIKPTGTFHLGNYISTIKPILNKDVIVLIADQHALISNQFNIKDYTSDLIKTFLSFGFTNIIRQSELPEISELNWILSCFTGIGFLNRSHAYKVAREYNLSNGFDENKGINAGLFNYPTLMTADNAIFDTEYVSVGKDQMAHLETANFIVNRFNHVYDTDILKIPKPMISDTTILGYDGRKMSKSYNNTVPLFCTEQRLKKHIFSMKTNSKNVGEPKGFDESPVLDLFKAISSDVQISVMKELLDDGIGWGDVKQITFDILNGEIKEAREKYDTKLLKSTDIISYHMDEIIYNVKEKLNEIKQLIY